MTDGITEIINRLQIIKNEWSAIPSLSEDLSGIIKGLTKTDITATLSKLAMQLEGAKESGQNIPAIYYQQITTQLQNIETYVRQHIPGNPSGHLPGFVNIIYALSLAIDASIVETPSGSESYLESFNKKLQSRLTESISKADIVNRLIVDAQELASKNKNSAQEIEQILKSSQESTTKIQERDRATTEATTRITETEKRSATLFVELEGNLKKVSESSDEIKNQQTNLSTLSTNLQNKLNEAQKLLEDANRHGLAGAFKTRKDDLNWPARGWIALFLLAIFGLSLLAFDSLRTQNGDWHLLLTRIPFSAPMIWLGWFSVKQYGYTRRIQEDYSFKVASAMSFQGYKNEVNTDAELLKLLRQSAIENFSSNPIRIYEDNKNHGSPIHELFENVSDEKLKKATEFIKAFTSIKS